jgi:hypothetical protein
VRRDGYPRVSGALSLILTVLRRLTLSRLQREAGQLLGPLLRYPSRRVRSGLFSSRHNMLNLPKLFTEQLLQGPQVAAPRVPGTDRVDEARRRPARRYSSSVTRSLISCVLRCSVCRLAGGQSSRSAACVLSSDRAVAPERLADLALAMARQGAGNAMFPIVQHNENPELSVFGFDYSKSAVEVVKVRPHAMRIPHVGQG